MPDVEDLVRSAFGDPPEDADARARALLRLRVEIAQAHRVKDPGSDASRRGVRLTSVAVAVVALALSVFVATGAPPPAAAASLEHLAAVNMALPRADSITIEEQHAVGRTLLGGGAFNLIVRSTVERTLNADGSVAQTETYQDVEFATEQDRSAWESLGEPDIPHAGQSDTVKIATTEQDWFDPSAISTNPATLQRGLEAGKVAGQWQGETGVFVLIGALLAEPQLDRAQRQALFDVAASLDGVQAEGLVTDPLGRQGLGYTYVTDGRRQTLIFDPSTGRPLATADQASGTPGLVEDWMAFSYPT